MRTQNKIADKELFAEFNKRMGKIRRKKFIETYLVLRDANKAAALANLKHTDIGERYLGDPFVFKRIAEEDYKFLFKKTDDEVVKMLLKRMILFADKPSERTKSMAELIKIMDIKESKVGKEIIVKFFDKKGGKDESVTES